MPGKQTAGQNQYGGILTGGLASILIYLLLQALRSRTVGRLALPLALLGGAGAYMAYPRLRRMIESLPEPSLPASSGPSLRLQAGGAAAGAAGGGLLGEALARRMAAWRVLQQRGPELRGTLGNVIDKLPSTLRRSLASSASQQGWTFLENLKGTQLSAILQQGIEGLERGAKGSVSGGRLLSRLRSFWRAPQKLHQAIRTGLESTLPPFSDSSIASEIERRLFSHRGDVSRLLQELRPRLGRGRLAVTPTRLGLLGGLLGGLWATRALYQAATGAQEHLRELVKKFR